MIRTLARNALFVKGEVPEDIAEYFEDAACGQCYVCKMVEIFREVRRVLRNDGTLWLNLGDSFASGKGTCYNPGGGETSLGKERKGTGAHPLDRGNKSSLKKSGLKPKDLVGIPWMVAFALRADGWYLRSDIIWSKPNPMPESITDRPTKSHEYIFLLAKSGTALFWTHRDKPGTRTKPDPDYRWVNKETDEETDVPQSEKEDWRRINLWRGYDYYYDADAIREKTGNEGYVRKANSDNDEYQYGDVETIKKKGSQHSNHHEMSNHPFGRNKRSVWEVTTQPFPDAHFAVFPPKLIEPCVLAGSASKACAECGAPWERVVDKPKPPKEMYTGTSKPKDIIPCQGGGGMGSKLQAWYEAHPTKTLGFRASCKCNAGTKPSIILDPFAGSGTTCLVAEQKGRDYIGIELNPEYIEIAKKRLSNLQPELFI